MLFPLTLSILFVLTGGLYYVLVAVFAVGFTIGSSETLLTILTLGLAAFLFGTIVYDSWNS